jgi:ribose 5-phosphate isomerase B
LRDGRVGRGVLICGAGVGKSIAANRHREIRGALLHDGLTARLARQHNDANVLIPGGRLLGPELASDCLKTFSTIAFDGGRHERRVAKMS